MFDPEWERKFLERVEEASYRGTLRAQSEISKTPVAEKQWLVTKEVVRDYEVSAQTLRRMRRVKEYLKFRKDQDWKEEHGKCYYNRKALDRELVRRTKNNVVSIKAA